jgi:Beta-xylosidase
MKKAAIILMTIACFVALHAENKLFIFRPNGSLIGNFVSKIDSLKFATNNTILQLYKNDNTVSSVTVSTIDSIKISDETTPSYSAPTYADDYSAISSWNYVFSWNLANVHDPTVAKYGNYYYMYQTDASYGNATAGRGHYFGRRSTDLVNWTYCGFPMANTPPTWVKDSLNAIRARMGLAAITSPSFGYWAPCVRKVGNVFRMYYCVVVDNYIATGAQNTTANFDNSWTERAFIGMMESTNPGANAWVDKGYVISSVTDKTTYYRSSLSDWSAYFKWNAIDPTYIVTPAGEHWLIYGSWHSGIPAVKLDPATGKPYQLNSLADYGTRVARRVNSDANRWQAQEGPEVIYNPKTGYYYLFLAYDELSVAYNTRVCRSTSINGPYLGINGSNITQGADCYPIITHPYKFNNHSGWVGISHCCAFQDSTTGQWYFSSQGRLPANTNGNAYSNAIMMGHIRKMMWTDDGWPVVLPERYGNVPQTTICDNDLVGNWEHITLSYTYQTQKTSTSLVLSADYKVSGTFTGTWSFNSKTNTLVIVSSSGTFRLKVQRELDWEASPRVPTIVYTGLNSSGYSLWGKKVQ